MNITNRAAEEKVSSIQWCQTLADCPPGYTDCRYLDPFAGAKACVGKKQN